MAKKEIKAVQRLIKLEADANGNTVVPDRIHLMTSGHWHTPWHGAFEMTPNDLAEMIVHFEEGIGSVEGSKKLPINFGHDISGKAAGWITALSLENNGTELWGDIAWTPYGTQMLADAEFRYISPEWNPRDFPFENPEVEGEFVENVLTGAGLTNIPLFKKLTPIMASVVTGEGDKSKKAQGGDMARTLEEVRAKKPEDLDDEDKSFLEEHKAELTDEERTTFGLTVEADGEGDGAGDGAGGDAGDRGEGSGDGAGKQASAGAHGLSASQIKQLQADAAAGRAASQQLLKTSLTASIEAGIKRGVIKSDQLEASVAMLMELPETHRASVLTFVDNLPENKLVASEIGSGAGVESSAQDELRSLAADIAKSDGISHAAAVKQVLDSNSDLAKRVEAERQ